jgi:ABC-type glycerol-3-phosphate transport system substrate-binding protein
MHPLLVKGGSAVAALVACAGFTLGSASAAAAQSAPQLSVSIQGPATLLAHGVAVSVPVVVNCSAEFGQASLYVSVNEAIGRRIASGAGYLQVNCTGLPETVAVTVVSYGVAFGKGRTALVQVGGDACTSVECAHADDSAYVKINRSG